MQFCKNLAVVLMIFVSVGFAAKEVNAYPNPGGPGNFGPISPIAAQNLTQLLYNGILFRSASPSELQYGINLIRYQDEYGLQQLASELASSYEFQQNIDARYSSDQIVVNLYRVFFNRYPDAPKPWTLSDLLDQGQASQAVVALVQSTEFRMRQLHRR